MNAKIGIDFHGVITDAPQIFSTFCHEIRQYGIKVYIISGGSEQDITKYLTSHNIEYDFTWSILDFYTRQNKVEYLPDGSFKVDTILWNKAKAEYCQQEGILFHIDDSSVYKKYFSTPYCKYNLQNDACEWNNITIDFNNPSLAAKQIAEIILRNNT